jgi:hypothetical protein
MPVDLAVFICQMHVRNVVIGFMNDQAPRIGMMPEHRCAAGRREERLRKLWAVCAVIQHGRKYSGLYAADYARRVCGIHQPLRDQRLHDGDFLGVR